MKPRHARIARLLSFLLLSSIAFSATFGAVHTHVSRLSGPAARASKAAGSVKAGDPTGGQTRGPLRGGDCSICQLHRQLSGGLLYGPVFTPSPPAEHAAAALVAVPYISTSNTPQRGRAPPQTSL